MRVSPLPGVSLAAIIVATNLGVAAQSTNKSATGTPAGSTREAAGAVAAPVVTPASSKDSPLVEAVRRGDKQAVQALLKRKADVNAPAPDGATALHWAVYAEDAETTALLIRAGA